MIPKRRSPHALSTSQEFGEDRANSRSSVRLECTSEAAAIGAILFGILGFAWIAFVWWGVHGGSRIRAGGILLGVGWVLFALALVARIRRHPLADIVLLALVGAVVIAGVLTFIWPRHDRGGG